MQTSSVGPKKYLFLLLAPIALTAFGFGMTVILSKSLERQVLPRMTGTFLKIRMQEFLEKMPQLFAQNEKFAFFWGASEIESALNTRVIDQVFQEKKMDLKAVNVGMRSIHPLAYRVFADRVQSELKSIDKKIDVSFIKFPGNKLTKVYRVSYPDFDQRDQIAKVLRVTNWDFARTRTVSYLEGLSYHFLLADADLNLPSEFLKNRLERALIVPQDKLIRFYFAPWFNREYLEKDLWSLDHRGSYRWNLPESATSFEKMVKMKQDREVRLRSYTYFENCCGISDLNFDRSLVKDFIQTVKTIQRSSKKVYLYEVPTTNEFNLWRNATYREKLDNILDYIQEETGVAVIKTDDIRLSDDMYLDFLHLNDEGQKDFYSILFDRLTSAR